MLLIVFDFTEIRYYLLLCSFSVSFFLCTKNRENGYYVWKHQRQSKNDTLKVAKCRMNTNFYQLSFTHSVSLSMCPYTGVQTREYELMLFLFSFGPFVIRCGFVLSPEFQQNSICLTQNKALACKLRILTAKKCAKNFLLCACVSVCVFDIMIWCVGYNLFLY